MSNVMRRGRDRYPSHWMRYMDSDVFNDSSLDYDLPAVNVKENAREYKLEFSAPGYDKSDFNIEVNKNMLTIRAKKEMSNEERDGEDKILRREFSYSSFERSFQMPDNVNSEAIEAEQHNGILTVSLPKTNKSTEDTKRRIEIK